MCMLRPSEQVVFAVCANKNQLVAGDIGNFLSQLKTLRRQLDLTCYLYSPFETGDLC